LWSASMPDVYNFPAVQVVSFLQNHRMLQLLDRPSWQTVAQRSHTYVQAAVDAILANNQSRKDPNGQHKIHTSAKVHSLIEIAPGSMYQVVLEDATGRLETLDTIFHDVICACHPPQGHTILKQSTFLPTNSSNDDNNGVASKMDRVLETLQNVEYADNVVYVHSDMALMPQQVHSWASWNCIGSADAIMNSSTNITTHDSESLHKKIHMNGDTGSDVVVDNDQHQHLEGTHGRFKAVYVT
jgi:predicted NAD/FAD-binding protein